MDLGNYRTSKQIARLYGVTLSTIHNWTRHGLPFHPLGNMKLFVESEVEVWLKAHPERNASRRAWALSQRTDTLDRASVEDLIDALEERNPGFEVLLRPKGETDAEAVHALDVTR